MVIKDLEEKQIKKQHKGEKLSVMVDAGTAAQLLENSPSLWAENLLVMIIGIDFLSLRGDDYSLKGGFREASALEVVHKTRRREGKWRNQRHCHGTADGGPAVNGVEIVVFVGECP